MKQDANAVELSAVASAFKAWDKNGDGSLEVAERTKLKEALKIEVRGRRGEAGGLSLSRVCTRAACPAAAPSLPLAQC